MVNIFNFVKHFSKGTFDQNRINCTPNYSKFLYFLHCERIFFKYLWTLLLRRFQFQPLTHSYGVKHTRVTNPTIQPPYFQYCDVLVSSPIVIPLLFERLVNHKINRMRKLFMYIIKYKWIPIWFYQKIYFCLCQDYKIK